MIFIRYAADVERLATITRRDTPSRRYTPSRWLFRFKVGGGIVDLPHPGDVAAALTPTCAVLVQGSSLASVTHPSAGVIDALAELPDRADASEAYVDLLVAARTRPPIYVDRYVEAVDKHVFWAMQAAERVG